jgi:membrane-bound serine protease (ClpP class)
VVRGVQRFPHACGQLIGVAAGLIAPGVAGAIMVLLGLGALSVLPINWMGAALLVLALVLFALEAKFVSHGVLAAGGALSMVLGALMLIESPQPELRIRLSTAIALALPFSVITAVLVSLVLRARRNKAMTGAEGMLGETGVALGALGPDGKVFVRGEYWDALASVPVAAGDKVRVIAINKLKLTVEPLSSAPGGLKDHGE